MDPTWMLEAFVPLHRTLTRRTLISGTFATALLAACRSGGSSSGSSAPAKTISHRFGTSRIAASFERLLLMGNRFDLETALALGLAPIAMGQEYAFRGGSVPYVAPWVPYTPADIEVYLSDDVSIERTVRLRPDLIFCQGYHLDSGKHGTFERLSAIAPVVPTNLLPWRDDLQQVAGWLDLEDRLARSFQEYDALRDGIKERHASRIASARVAFGSVEPPNVILRSLDDPHGPAARALADLGGQVMPLSVPASRVGFFPIGMENLREMAGADAILIWAPDDTIRSTFLAHPLWPLLPAVQAGRAVVSTNNVGQGSIYTVMECLRLWDQVYATLA